MMNQRHYLIIALANILAIVVSFSRCLVRDAIFAIGTLAFARRALATASAISLSAIAVWGAISAAARGRARLGGLL